MTIVLPTGSMQPAEDIRHISLDLIDVPNGRRVLDPDWVEALAGDFLTRGQQTSIETIERAGRFQLVYGGHRFAAAKLNKWPTIRTVVRQPGEFAGAAQIKLAEIVENFFRRELSVLDRAFDVAAWRDIFEAVNGDVRRGGDRRSDQSRKSATLIDDPALTEISGLFADTFTVAAQKALRLSRDAVFRSLKIARLGERLRQRISLLPIANNQSELLALQGQPAPRQDAIVDRLIAGAASVADAIAIIDDVPPVIPMAKWEKVSETFSRLPAAEQHNFFSLHEDAVLQWVASRKA